MGRGEWGGWGLRVRVGADEEQRDTGLPSINTEKGDSGDVVILPVGQLRVVVIHSHFGLPTSNRGGRGRG